MSTQDLEKQATQDAEYLKQSHIGEVIGQALTEVYIQKPKFPIDFLSKWLLNYCQSIKEQDKLKRDLAIQKQLKEEHEQELNEAKEALGKQQEQKQEINKQYQEFQEMFTKHQYQEELLESILPNFIAKRYNVNCYIGFLDYPTKSPLIISDEIDGHLEKTLPKVIKYIGYCDNSKAIMEGQSLVREEGVSWSVLKGQLEDEDQQDDQNQDEDDTGYPTRKPTYLYIPDVIKNEQIKYFKLPSLGSYLCVSLSYFSCFETIDSLEQGVQTRMQYQQEKEEKMKRRLERETEIQEMLKDHEEEPEEIQQIEEQFEAEKEQDPIWVDTEEGEFIKVRRSFIVGVDTVGQDRQISEKDRDSIELLSQEFVQAWEKQESEILSMDINNQISYIEQVGQSYEQIIEGFQQDEENLIMERQQQLDELKDKEVERHYEEECVRLEKVGGQLVDSEVVRWWQTMKSFRMIKFPGILQTVLILLGYKIEEISIPGTFNLNWKYVKGEILDDEKFEKEEERFINRMLSYEHRGPKSEEVPEYAKINRLIARKEKFVQAEVDQFNIAYGRLFRWLDLTLKLRKMNIELRRMQKEQMRQERENRLAENEMIRNKKIEDLENHKANLIPEELEAFDEEEWEKQFDEQLPLYEIPPEVVEDIDLDIEDEAELAEEQAV